MIRSEFNFSVVVPVYNVENFLVRCLDSIFNQHFSGTFEVIAVEDASTDNSLQVLKSYQTKEPRLKIIAHELNKKLSVARTNGMIASSGAYIMHVDSDDWLLPGTFEALHKKCIESDADVLVFNYMTQNSKGQINQLQKIRKEVITTDKILVQHLFLGASVNKVVKRSLTDNLLYGEVALNTAEDLLYSSELLLKAHSIHLLPNFHYVYFLNNDSLTRNIGPKELLERLIVILQQIRTITLKYQANSRFTNNILTYLERDTHLAISRLAFLITESKMLHNDLINAFLMFPEMNNKRLNKLILSINNKYYSLWRVFCDFGAKSVLLIVLTSISRFFKRK